MKKFCDRIGFPSEATDFLCCTYNEMKLDEKFEDAMDSFFSTDTNEYIDMLQSISEESGVNRYTVDMLFLIKCAKLLMYIYRQKDLSDELYWETIQDLRYKLIECKQLHGVWGTFVLEWFRGFYQCKRFKLGRLQYETIEFKHDYKDIIKKGDTVLNCHIPSCGPLTSEEVEQSFAMARDFFGIDVITCHSWLLYPPHYEVFPENSNMRRFYEFFDVIESESDENGDLWRVFYKNKFEDVEPSDIKTTLHKRFYEFLSKGNKMGEGLGVVIKEENKMKIFDMHIHAFNEKPNPEDIIAKMEQAGIYGGCIFSNPPAIKNADAGTIFAEGTSFDERLEEVIEWTKDYKDRLFPVIWIHPDEENLIENIHKAVDKGIVAFKIICNNFYVYEEKCMSVLREIAKLDKPVFFHSGILYDGGVSSKYNRPLNWEALLEIEGLRFSMGHCSWPWVDECVSLYGKFSHTLTRRNAAEMFFDITPGTPKIYRKELLTKLYTVGYNVGNNMLFGIDTEANKYNWQLAKSWLEIDKAIMDELCVSKKNIEALYQDNLMRFLGKGDKKLEHIRLGSDMEQDWKCYN